MYFGNHIPKNLFHQFCFRNFILKISKNLLKKVCKKSTFKKGKMIIMNILEGAQGNCGGAGSKVLESPIILWMKYIKGSINLFHSH